MRQLQIVFVFLLAMLAAGGNAIAQATGSISPNNIESGASITVTLSGLPANTTITVKFMGVGEGENGQPANQERQVTTNGDGVASWSETIDWPPDTYATNISWRIGSGHPANTTAGTLNVDP